MNPVLSYLAFIANTCSFNVLTPSGSAVSDVWSFGERWVDEQDGFSLPKDYV